MKLILISSLIFGVASALIVDRRQDVSSTDLKKHGKRGTLDLKYGEHDLVEAAPFIYEQAPAVNPVPIDPLAVYSLPVHPPAEHLFHPILVQSVERPVAVPVDRPVPVPVTVDRPVAVAVPVPKPYPVHIEKIVHVPVEKIIQLPSVEKVVHVNRPYAVLVPKPYPVVVEKYVPVSKPYLVHVGIPVQVPKPYPVPVAIQTQASH